MNVTDLSHWGRSLERMVIATALIVLLTYGCSSPREGGTATPSIKKKTADAYDPATRVYHNTDLGLRLAAPSDWQIYAEPARALPGVRDLAKTIQRNADCEVAMLAVHESRMLVAVLYVEMDVRGLNGPEYAQVVEDTLAGGDEGKNPGRKLVGKQPRLIGGRAFVELKYEWREDGMPSRMRCLISVLRQHGLRLVCQGPSSLIELKSESIDTLLAGLAVE